MKSFGTLAFLLSLSVVLSIAAEPADGQVDLEQLQIPSPLAQWQAEVKSPAETQAPSKTPTTQSISLEVRLLVVDGNSKVLPASFFKPGSLEVHSGSMPKVELDSDLAQNRLSVADDPASSTTQFVESCDSVRKSMPVIVAKLDDQGVTALAKQLGSAYKSIPTASCYSGDSAVITDLMQRPFVVGVKPVKSANAIGHTPIIQLIEDGVVLHINPTVKDTSIELAINLAHSSISNVETFTISGNESEGVAIQIPEQSLKRVHLAASVEDGETLFLDPRLTIKVDQKQERKIRFKKSKVVEVAQQVYFLVTPRLIRQADERVASLTP